MRIHRDPDVYCPICGKPDWCLAAWECWGGLPVTVICARIHDSVHGDYEFVKHIPNSGTLYRLKGAVTDRVASSSARRTTAPTLYHPSTEWMSRRSWFRVAVRRVSRPAHDLANERSGRAASDRAHTSPISTWLASGYANGIQYSNAKPRRNSRCYANPNDGRRQAVDPRQ